MRLGYGRAGRGPTKVATPATATAAFFGVATLPRHKADDGNAVADVYRDRLRITCSVRVGSYSVPRIGSYCGPK